MKVVDRVRIPALSSIYGRGSVMAAHENVLFTLVVAIPFKTQCSAGERSHGP
jgi:hypothetical protein